MELLVLLVQMVSLDLMDLSDRQDKRDLLVQPDPTVSQGHRDQLGIVETLDKLVLMVNLVRQAPLVPKVQRGPVALPVNLELLELSDHLVLVVAVERWDHQDLQDLREVLERQGL